MQTTRALHSSEFTRDLIIGMYVCVIETFWVVLGLRTCFKFPFSVQNIQLELGIVAGVAPFVYEGDSNHLVSLSSSLYAL